MIIDFHTHAFPDSLAPKATYVLQKGVRDSGLDFSDILYGDGTASGLVSLMDKAGVDISVLLPVATKSGQADGINKWAKEAAQSGRIFPFGALFPDENALYDAEKLAEQGYKGVKLHGDFQGFHADDPRMIELYRKCGELGLTVVLHAGLDCVSVNDIHVTPEHMVNVLEKTYRTRFVLAHMGGILCEEKAADMLSGSEYVYVDTAFAAGRLAPDVMTDLIRRYGADKVLFGSDCPWNDPADDIRLIEKCRLTPEEREMIFSQNARRLTGL